MASYIERDFHKTIWNATNEWQGVEQAVHDARNICYMALEYAEDDSALRHLITMWLDQYGRNALKEAPSKNSSTGP